VTYKDHQVRYENNPFTGEKLFIDNRLWVGGSFGIGVRCGGRS